MAKMHEGKVERVADERMAAHLEQRIAAITLPKSFASFVSEGDPPEETPNPDYEEKVDYETERAQEGWEASCSCGWLANNPLPAKAAANEAVTEHFQSVENRLEGLGV